MSAVLAWLMTKRPEGLPEWAPAICDVVAVPVPGGGELRFLVGPVDPGQRAEFEVQAVEAPKESAKVVVSPRQESLRASERIGRVRFMA